MCDQVHFDDDLKKYSRRDFATLAAAGVGAAMLLPRAASAAEASESDVRIETPDGECDAYFATPRIGAHAAVLVWPDIFGLRPAFRTMGKRLAESGYSVLVVNPFYRTMKAPTAPDGANTPIPDVIPLARSLDASTTRTDARAFITWLDAQPQVDKNKKVGTTGYCMGGPLVMRTAAAMADRVGAAATFHGGGLVTDGPDSPHLLIPQMQAQFLIAIAENDDERDPNAKTVLKDAFADAKLTAEIEVYPAGHGWCPPDTNVYNHDQAEKAWQRMLALSHCSRKRWSDVPRGFRKARRRRALVDAHGRFDLGQKRGSSQAAESHQFDNGLRRAELRSVCFTSSRWPVHFQRSDDATDRSSS